MVTLTSTGKLGDLLKMEYDYRYTRVQGQWTNGTGSSKTLPLGQPFSIDESNGNLTNIESPNEADTECILLHPVDKVVANGETVELTVLINGPALINKNALPDADLVGATAYDKDAIMTALEAKVPAIKELIEPTVTSTQTT